MTATSTIRTPQTTASSRALKISVSVAAVWTPCLRAFAACARKPRAGSGEKIFCQAAVNVTVTSQTSGTQVIHM